MAVSALFSAFDMLRLGWVAPVICMVVYAFLAIQVEGYSVLDFLRRRYEAEPEPAIRIKQDAERFQQLKVQAVIARRFLLAVPMGEGAEHRSRRAMLEALLHEQGFYGK